MQQQERLVDGDDFNACFARLIKQLFHSMGKAQEITVIGTIASSAALGKYLAKIGVNYEAVPVGIREVVTAVRQHQVGCYFESSGHGAFHFSAQLVAALEKEREEHWQARVLLHLHGLSRNVTLRSLRARAAMPCTTCSSCSSTSSSSHRPQRCSSRRSTSSTRKSTCRAPSYSPTATPARNCCSSQRSWWEL